MGEDESIDERRRLAWRCRVLESGLAMTLCVSGLSVAAREFPGEGHGPHASAALRSRADPAGTADQGQDRGRVLDVDIVTAHLPPHPSGPPGFAGKCQICHRPSSAVRLGRRDGSGAYVEPA